MNDVERKRVHECIDRWLDYVAAHPVLLDDGETHKIVIEAALSGYDADDNPLTWIHAIVEQSELL